MSSPSRVQGRAPTENEFGYSTASGNYVDDSEVYILH